MDLVNLQDDLFKQSNIRQIKKHLRKLLRLNYKKLTPIELLTIEHILYYNLIRVYIEKEK